MITILKSTKQREMILDLIRNSSGHMTADQIHSKLKESNKSLGIATIYRNLNLLYDYNLINRVKHPEYGYIYDRNISKHYHLYCVECNEIYDVEIEFDKTIEAIVEKKLNCKVLDHETIFEGICEKCYKNTNKNKSQ